MLLEWSNQTCLLTGAYGGIGKEVALALDKKGVTLLLQGRNEQKLETLLSQLSHPHKHTLLCGDLNDKNYQSALFEQLKKSNGLTMVINNAGVSGSGCVEALNDRDIAHVVQTNLTSTILICHHVLPILQQHPGATLVNIGSIFGSIGHPGYALYCATKFGLRGFTESIQREYSDTNINIQYFAPRATRTPINSDKESQLNKAMGNKIDEPQWVAEQLIQAIAHKSPRTYLGFPESLFVKVNGILPTLVDSALRKKVPLIKQFLSNREIQQ